MPPTIVDGGSPFGNAVKVSANNSSSYVKHRVYEIDQEHLDNYAYNYSMFSKNVGAQFIVSGFAKAVDASLLEQARALDGDLAFNPNRIYDLYIKEIYSEKD